jgi:Ca2+-transporting ATPase
VLGGGSLAGDAALVEQDGQWTIQGDPTDAAFLVAERKLGITEQRSVRFRRVGEVPFTSERKLMSTVEADAAREGRIDVVTKGAPDVLLARCTHERAGAAEEELTETRRAEILAEVDRLAEAALRTLAVAYHPWRPPSRRRPTSPWSRGWCSRGWSASSTRHARRRPPRSARRTMPACGSS